jgi:Protein of unknown function (DUF4236)/PEGA domain
MGKFRLGFRKSIKIAPGVRFNIGKKSMGFSLSILKGLSYSINSRRGSRIHAGIPGTGFFVSKSLNTASSVSKPGMSRGTFLFWLLAVILAISWTYANTTQTASEASKTYVNLSISSDPSGAALTVDGKNSGITPTTVKLESGKSFSYTLVAPEPYEYNLYKPYSGTFTSSKDDAVNVWLERTTAEEQQAQIQTINATKTPVVKQQVYVNSFSDSGCGPGETWVDSYVKKNGTRVSGYCRS